MGPGVWMGLLLMGGGWEEEALRVLNAYRLREGSPPVRWMSTAVPQARAEELRRWGRFSHYSPTGRPPTLLWTRKGWVHAFEENLYGLWTGGGIPFSWSRERIRRAVREGIRMFVEEDGPAWLHRKSLLNPCHTHMDAGVVAVPDTFYLVVYMITDRVRWTLRPSWVGGRFEMAGRLDRDLDPRGMQVMVYRYRPDPRWTRQEFYTLGDPVMGVVPHEGVRYRDVATRVADRWEVKGQDVHLAFSLDLADEGVYTVEVRAPFREPRVYSPRPGKREAQTSCALVHYTVAR